MSELKLSKLTKKDLKQIFIHNVLGLQLGWNYEKMQGLGYAYSVMPALKRLYKDDPAKMKQASIWKWASSIPPRKWHT